MDAFLEIEADPALVLELGGDDQQPGSQLEGSYTDIRRNYQHAMDRWSLAAQEFVKNTEQLRVETAVIPGERKITDKQKKYIRVVETRSAWEDEHQSFFLRSAKRFKAVTVDTESQKKCVSPVLLILGTLDGNVWILDLRRWREELKLPKATAGELLPESLKEFLSDPDTTVAGSAIHDEQGELGVTFGRLLETQDWILWLDARGGVPYQVPEAARQRELKGLEVVQYGEYGYHTKTLAYFTKDALGKKGQERWQIFQKSWPYKDNREARFRAGSSLYFWPERLMKSTGQLLYCANDAWAVTQFLRRLMIQALLDKKAKDTEDPCEWLRAVQKMRIDVGFEDEQVIISVEKFFTEAREKAAEDSGKQACLNELESLVLTYDVLKPQIEELTNILLGRSLWSSMTLVGQEWDDQEVFTGLASSHVIFQGTSQRKLTRAEFTEAEMKYVQGIRCPDNSSRSTHGRQNGQRFSKRAALKSETAADPVQPWKCLFCGLAKHTKQQIDGTPVCHEYQESLRAGNLTEGLKMIRCMYPLCPERVDHCTAVCTTLSHLCQKCFRRGHIEIGCRGQQAYAAAECLKHLFDQFKDHHNLTRYAGLTRTVRAERLSKNIPRMVNLAFGFWRVPINLPRGEVALDELQGLTVREVEALLINKCPDVPIYDAEEFVQRYKVLSRDEWLGCQDLDKREQEENILKRKRTHSLDEMHRVKQSAQSNPRR